MYLIQESNKVFDMHLRKRYNDIRLKKILITTYNNKYYFGTLKNYHYNAYGNRITSSFFLLKIGDKNISIYNNEIKNIYLETVKKFEDLEIYDDIKKKFNYNIISMINKFVGPVYLYSDAT